MTEPAPTAAPDEYAIKGTRPGWNLAGLTREERPDGYSNFRRPDGTLQAVILTTLLVKTAALV